MYICILIDKDHSWAVSAELFGCQKDYEKTIFYSTRRLESDGS
jgi:hypothetical protein